MNLEKLKHRYSVKRFDSDKRLDAKTVDVIVDSFYLSPSSLNIQPWKLVVVADKALKAKLAAAGMDANKHRIEECSHLLILMRKKISFKHIYEVLDTSKMLQITMQKKGLSRFQFAVFIWLYARLKGQRRWASQQVYLGLGFVLAACSELGVGALPMEGIKGRLMDRILGQGSEYKAELAVALGHPHAKDADNPSRLHKSRLPKDQVVQFI